MPQSSLNDAAATINAYCTTQVGGAVRVVGQYLAGNNCCAAVYWAVLPSFDRPASRDIVHGEVVEIGSFVVLAQRTQVDGELEVDLSA